jgi:2-aminoethylphosphonate-pyruvate transaminase
MSPTVLGSGAELVLLCPGPVMLSPGVRDALSEGGVGHRDVLFSEILARLRRNCASVLGAGADHSVVFVTGPATAGIEAACTSLVPPGAVVIVPVNGTFGQRIADILGVHGIRCVPIDFGFGQPVDLARVEAAMLEQRGAAEFAAVAMTHHETSSGLLNPVSAVAALA